MGLQNDHTHSYNKGGRASVILTKLHVCARVYTHQVGSAHQCVNRKTLLGHKLNSQQVSVPIQNRMRNTSVWVQTLVHNMLFVNLLKHQLGLIWLYSLLQLLHSSSYIPPSVPDASVYTPSDENPNCLHTTEASFMSHPRLQTVPHTLSRHISTLPSKSVAPSLSLISPSSSTPHCWQFTVETLGMANRIHSITTTYLNSYSKK